MPFTVLFLLLVLTQLGHALCPGYNFAFFDNTYPISLIKDEADQGFIAPFAVTDNSCNIVYGCAAPNPCDCSHIKCANLGANTYVNRIAVTSPDDRGTLWYMCRWDVNAGSCILPHIPGGDYVQPVESCCELSRGRMASALQLIFFLDHKITNFLSLATHSPTKTTMHPIAIYVLLAFARLSQALCPGYNYAFFSLSNVSWRGWRWLITDNNCYRVGSPCGFDNPCHCPSLGCSPPPAHVDKIVVNGLWYLCRPDVNAGACSVFEPEGVTHPGGVGVESCCRNDGKRNLKEGLISEREYEAIEDTNAVLDIHLREYAEAVSNGTSVEIMEVMREVQKRDLKLAEAKQLKARGEDALMKLKN
ncbi:uncharacterized protein PAC_17730 [Phialocephala subalpina]|uniref:Uncharacterized protein n=1 Tax=Phialocephala subalpina TaxID=576137 RepID=A0A1L7XS02_9HELO|nr:uncharacterized protein PAC_17730 [Phialocephala subalpina]